MANQVFEFLHGKRVTLDGIAGTLQHEITRAIYPYPHTVERLIHVPSKAAQRGKRYQETRAQLGDDWITDLTGDVERYCGIAMRHGYQWEG